ncbi:MAG TPA: cupin domain-containing protein [Candidatus Aphodomonas merdavium]|nr:cupin domain-containing protein [Candidatus Aphodomonas merdavium]
MVYRQGEHSVETRESMRGGKGSVQITNLEKALLPQNCRLFGVLRLAPGCSIGEHPHEGEAEMFYFVQGEGVVMDDGVAVPVRAGDSMTTASGHRHSVENTGDEELVIVAAIVKG